MEERRVPQITEREGTQSSGNYQAANQPMCYFLQPCLMAEWRQRDSPRVRVLADGCKEDQDIEKRVNDRFEFKMNKEKKICKSQLDLNKGKQGKVIRGKMSGFVISKFGIF